MKTSSKIDLAYFEKQMVVYCCIKQLHIFPTIVLHNGCFYIIHRLGVLLME